MFLCYKVVARARINSAVLEAGGLSVDTTLVGRHFDVEAGVVGRDSLSKETMRGREHRGRGGVMGQGEEGERHCHQGGSLGSDSRDSFYAARHCKGKTQNSNFATPQLVTYPELGLGFRV